MGEMNITTFAVSLMGGTSFPCNITEYFHTIAYRVSSYKVEGGNINPLVVKKTDNFKATVVTNPISYLLSDTFLDHRVVDKGFEEALKKKCEEDEKKAEKTIFVIIQFKEDLGTFPVVDGQCVRFEHDDVESYVVFDCIDARAPTPNDHRDNIDLVLCAVKAELEITDALQKTFDANCFNTREGKCVHGAELSASAHVQVVSPITSHDLSIRSQAISDLVAKIETAIGKPSQGRSHCFGQQLERLVKALQLNPTTDDALLRLWYLQLWDRVEKLGEAFRPRLQLSNRQDLKNEKCHRNDIAHFQVDKLDWKMYRSLQKKVYGLLKQRL